MTFGSNLSVFSSLLFSVCLAACTVETASTDDDDDNDNNNDSQQGAAGQEETGEGGGSSSAGGTSAKADAGESSSTAGNSSVASTQGGERGTSDTARAGEGGQEPTGSGGSAGSPAATAGSAGSASADAQGGAAGSGTTIIEDPAPFATQPGETNNCSGAPETNLTVFEYTDLTETTRTFQGTVTGATGPGMYYVASGTQAISGTVPTDTSTGAFGVELPLFCGEQTVKLVWTNGDCAVAAVSRVVRVDCSDDDIRLTVTWDNLGYDYELHLIKPGGRINDNATDCTWTSCISGSPDWGVAGDATDDPRKDVDNTGNYGPENIYYSTPEAGTYTVMVEHWGSGSADSDGEVIFNVAGRTYSVTITNLASHFVWTAGTIEWPSGNVATSQDVYDCTGSWSGGCTAEIP